MKILVSSFALMLISAPAFAGWRVESDDGGSSIVVAMLTLLFVALLSSNSSGDSMSTKNGQEAEPKKGDVLMKF